MRLSLFFLLLQSSIQYCLLVESFVAQSTTPRLPRRTFGVARSSTTDKNNVDSSSKANADDNNKNDYNSVFVAKTGGRGATTASQQALEKNLSLGAPPARPSGGHYLTKGGLQVTAHVEPLEFSSELKAGTSANAIENLVQKLDDHKGVLLTSSYEFPGRYARWSLGFVDPPLEISGRGSKCSIRALNARGKVLMPAIEEAMNSLKSDGILKEVHVTTESDNIGSGDAMDGAASRVDVEVVPPSEVGSFSEEERSRQVSTFCCNLICNYIIALWRISFLNNSFIYFALLQLAIAVFSCALAGRSL
jgi:hypothetical protein